jgi:hypothetical protein
MADADWHFLDSDEAACAFAFADAAAKYAAGDFDDDTLVWAEGATDGWVRLPDSVLYSLCTSNPARPRSVPPPSPRQRASIDYGRAPGASAAASTAEAKVVAEAEEGVDGADWYYLDESEERQGGFTKISLENKMKDGGPVTPDTLVWKEGWDDWKPASMAGLEVWGREGHVDAGTVLGAAVSATSSNQSAREADATRYDERENMSERESMCVRVCPCVCMCARVYVCVCVQCVCTCVCARVEVFFFLCVWLLAGRKV